MRVLLTSNASHLPPRGGSTRSNLIWLEHLAAQGHTCEVVAAAADRDTTEKRDQVRAELAAVRQQQNGIAIYSVEEPSRRPQVLRERIQALQPDWVLVSSEDLGHVLLREAHRSAPGRVVYLAHTPQFYPFGPAAWNPDPHATELVRQSAGLVAIGHHTAGYIEEHAGRSAEVIHPPLYGAGPWPDLSNSREGLVTMINPCAVKGLPIFLELATRLPEIAFGALHGWGTTHADREAMAQLPNVSLLPNVKDIEQVLGRTRLLLMPSLWYEGFGLIVMEAMLRGIPVIASDAGGLVEAKRGTDYVVPVRAIERYELVFDEVHMPRPVVPQQDVRPWEEAIRELLQSEAMYKRASAAARTAAHEFVRGLHAGQMETYLAGLLPGKSVAAEDNNSAAASDAFARLSPERRALLLKRLRQQQQQSKS